MRVVSSMTALVVGLSTMFVAAGPAVAAADARGTVWVQVARDVGIARYDIDYAIRSVNAHTRRTRLVRGRCIAGPARCIHVTFAAMPARTVYAMAHPPAAGPGYIRLAPRSVNLTGAARRRLFLHELGHTRNLAHGRTCQSVMFHWVYCRGKLVPYAFTPREIAALRRQ